MIQTLSDTCVRNSLLSYAKFWGAISYESGTRTLQAWFPALRCRYAVAGVRMSVSVVTVSWTCNGIGWKPISVAMNVKQRKRRFWMRHICCRRS